MGFGETRNTAPVWVEWLFVLSGARRTINNSISIYIKSYFKFARPPRYPASMNSLVCVSEPRPAEIRRERFCLALSIKKAKTNDYFWVVNRWSATQNYVSKQNLNHFVQCLRGRSVYSVIVKNYFSFVTLFPLRFELFHWNRPASLEI